MTSRRSVLTALAAMSGAAACATPGPAVAGGRRFPAGFLWGAATAGHQVEGNNTASDLWLLENLKETAFAEPSGDACNSFLLWETDLEIAKSLGFSAYRFSVEWARIEPERGHVSPAMLDHYKRIVDGCRARGMAPVVTFQHFTAPRWFSAMGGWTNPDAPGLFAAYCDRVIRHLGDGISHAVTMNEPNILLLLQSMGLPPQVKQAQRAMLEAAARACGTARFVAANVAVDEDLPAMQENMLKGHRAAVDAIRAVRPDLPVGVSLAMADEQAEGDTARRDAVNSRLYGAWLETARQDSFIGVQNYERRRWGPNGALPPPEGADLNFIGSEVWAPSLAGAVRYAHKVTGKPVFVSEHGVGTTDDTLRARFIPAALSHLLTAIDDGVPVIGYMHWSMLDNFEWIFGYRPRFGLCEVDRTSFERTPKASALVYRDIIRQNGL